jgi:dTDP-4-amino-4,6-dideoxygalactose transaminase
VLAAQSFHETKNFTCGEGGALLINDPALVERAEIIREKGTNRSRFFRGQVDKYSWVDVGSSYLPSDILAAFLLAQLEQREKVQNLRRKVWEFYRAPAGLGARTCGQPAVHPAVLRTVLPHVLHAPANAGTAAGIDRTSTPARH